MNKKLSFLLCCILIGNGISAQTNAVQNAGANENYRLVWADEFDKKGGPDPQNWQFERGFVRNNELQWYQEENAFCDSGMLIIEARRENRPNKNYRQGSSNWRTNRENIEYTSASINTRGLHIWKYGRFVMRGRIDVSEGLWPAFWTLGIQGEWPSNGEIDIMEYYKGDILANIAHGTSQRYTAKWYSVKKPVKEFNDPDWASKFHIWRMDWDEKSISLYVDDELLNRVELKDLVNTDTEKLNPFE